MSVGLLSADHLSRSYGGIRAVSDVGLSVGQSEILGLVGPNGAGKTTLVNLVLGLERPDRGRVWLGGRDVTRAPVHVRAALGVGRTFQNPRVFGELSVLDNVLTAARCRSQPSLVRALTGLGTREFEGHAHRRAFGALARAGLSQELDRPASALSFGEQRLLELARALALEPSVLLLDEPFSGLDDSERARLMALLDALRSRGLGLLLVEHDVPAVMQLADRVLVMHQGQVVVDGTPDEVRATPAAVAVYFGTPTDVPLPLAPSAVPASQPLLLVDDLHVRRGRVPALHGVSMRVNRGELVAVVGPNGAGKSTLLGTLAGLFPPARGRMTFDGKVVDGLPPESRVGYGLALVPERRQVFEPLSVLENLRVGAPWRLNASTRRERLARVFALFPRLDERQGQVAGTLSGGEQQMLAIGRALMAAPRLLMLDEPTLGLAPRVIDDILRAIADLRSAGTTILMIEHNTHVVSMADRSYALERGVIGPAASR